MLEPVGTTNRHAFLIQANYQKRRTFVGTKITPPNINAKKKEFVYSLN
jgi:hypothetical protein